MPAGIEPKRIFRFSHQYPETGLFNLAAKDEYIIYPHAPKGVISSREALAFGIKKRFTKLGHGFTREAQQIYDRHDVEEIISGLMAIDIQLAPKKEDILLGWINPTDFSFVYNGVLQTSSTVRSSAPVNISSFPGRKILTVGDTHHNPYALTKAIEYVINETWDIILIAHQPSHIEWFRRAAGKEKVHLYKLQIPPWRKQSFEQSAVLPFNSRQKQRLCFYGGTSHLHPHRSRIFKELESNYSDIFERKDRLAVDEWCKDLSKHKFVACGTLNNNISINQIYSMLAGCLVFSDSFYQANGIGKLIKDMLHIAIYTDSESLIEGYMLLKENRELSQRIAAEGKNLIERKFLGHPRSNHWLGFDEINEISNGIKIETKEMEDETEPEKWDSIHDLKQDIRIYSIIQDLAVYHDDIVIVTDHATSKPLIDSIRRQQPRVSVISFMAKAKARKNSVIVFMRPCYLVELLNIGRVSPKGVLFMLTKASDTRQLEEDFIVAKERLNGYQLIDCGVMLDRYHLGNPANCIGAPNAYYILPDGWTVASLKQQ